MSIRFGETDERAERRDDPARAIEVAASDIAACLWSDAYARLCGDGLPRDMRTARDRGVPIVVLRLEDSPPVPTGLFPPGTRVVEVPRDPEAGATVIKRLATHGIESFPFLEPPTNPEGTTP